MAAGQPGKKSACADDDTRTLAATGSQQPPMECHRNCSTAQLGGKHCSYADISLHLPVCVREKLDR